ncbi:MAG: hypothetical protein MI810_11380 [Flavobacteriales bacterium]|jgi:hypothetical protein|nr:hypothetical protein [Flavobacteriales bacterium]
MCKDKKHLTFCTCELKESDDLKSQVQAYRILNDKTEYHKLFYSWRLERTIRKYSTEEKKKIIGELVLPAKKLNAELTAVFVTNALNENAEFDFDYTPKDGDELIISLKYQYVQIENHARSPLPPPMKFVYENEEWYFGYVNHFEYKKEQLKTGKLNLSNNDQE